jgi:hypothetical protein
MFRKTIYKTKKTSPNTDLLNYVFKDEHQGEGGTLVFVAAYNTMTYIFWQEGNC